MEHHQHQMGRTGSLAWTGAGLRCLEVPDSFSTLRFAVTGRRDGADGKKTAKVSGGRTLSGCLFAMLITTLSLHASKHLSQDVGW